MAGQPQGSVRRMSESAASYIPYRKPPVGAPNVVVIVLDDIGFAQLGCFGSAIATPDIDRLAAGGLRYNRFHVTSICSSTRAALLTGRNHHAVGMGMTMETPLGFPGYTGRMPKSAALLPRILRDAGYSTMAVGKWHLCPRGEYSAAGPMDRWPLGQGFERLLRLPGCRDQSVGLRRWCRTTRTSNHPVPLLRVSPERGSGRSGHQDGPGPAPGRSGQAVLLLPSNWARPMPRIRCRDRGSSLTRAHLMTAGRPSAPPRSRASWRRAWCQRAPS